MSSRPERGRGGDLGARRTLRGGPYRSALRAAARPAPRSRRLGFLRGSALAALVLLAACTGGDGSNLRPFTLGIEASGALSAAQFSLAYVPANTRFVGLAGGDAAVLARAYDDGSGTVTIGLVAAEPVAGMLVDAVFEGDGAVRIAGQASYGPDRSRTSATLRLRREEDGGLRRTAMRARGAAWDSLPSAIAPATLPATTPDAMTLAAQAIEPPVLEPEFADSALGDLDEDGAIDVLDVLISLDIATEAAPGDAYQRYSADLVPDDAVDVADVIALLDKAVDPTLPAAMVVKPDALTYLGLVADVPILVGNAGNQPLDGLDFDVAGTVSGSVTNGIAGQTAAFEMSGDPNASFGRVTVDSAAGTQTVPIGNVVVLIAGQSNAEGQGQPMTSPEQAVDGVRMLGNDYVWKAAAEPTDSDAGQLDIVSLDGDPLYSFGVRMGNRVRLDTGHWSYLIPAALGGSSYAGNPGNGVSGWSPAGVSPVDNRDFLSGSAIFRGFVSAGLRPMPPEAPDPGPYPAEGGPVRAVAWYQGESESRSNSNRNTYVGSTKTLFNTFTAQFDGSVIIYAQLAAEGQEAGVTVEQAITANLQQADIAERQRRLEAGAAQLGIAATEPSMEEISPLSKAFMVVTHDLPMSDHIHLSRAGQEVLGNRIALAIEEHVLGLPVDGTGPRLVSLSRPSPTTVKVDTTRTVNQDSGADAYEGYFTVFDGAPSGTDIETPSTYGQNTIAIQYIQRDPNDASAVLITLSAAPSGTPYVRYMPPPLRPYGAGNEEDQLTDVVHDPDTGLPLPSFGPLPVP